MRVNDQQSIFRRVMSKIIVIAIVVMIVLDIAYYSDLTIAKNELTSISFQDVTYASCSVLCMEYQIYETSGLCCFDQYKVKCKTKQKCKSEKMEYYQAIYDEDLRDIIIFSITAFLLVCIYFYFFLRCCRSPV
jgi:hypothetical protein